jgi:mannose-1-phosphate guanylyltransferase
MNYNDGNQGQRWAILLAGGEGKRLSALTRQITGNATPKQFCPVIGNRPLIEQTIERVALAISREEILIAVTRNHERFYKPILATTSPRSIVQPENRGTAPAILYALFRLAELARDARVALFPCDHFVLDGRGFMRHVELAFDAIDRRPELTVLLGIAPDRPETGYGWIEPGKVVANGPVFLVRRFWEKPRTELASELLERGCLWNSFVMVGRLSTLLGLFMIALPDLYLAFKKVQPTLGTVFEHKTVERLYRDLSDANFSDEVLARYPVNLAVLPVAGVEWSDLGEPHRVMDMYARIGVRPQWIAA